MVFGYLLTGSGGSGGSCSSLLLGSEKLFCSVGLEDEVVGEVREKVFED